MRQASRRSWRIGQPLACKTVFMYYAETLQERAMSLMGKKMSAAEALEGKFSTEGLAAMGGDDDASYALAKALVGKVDTSADRAWSKVLGFSGSAEVAPPRPALKLVTGSPTIEFTEAEWASIRALRAKYLAREKT